MDECGTACFLNFMSFNILFNLAFIWRDLLSWKNENVFLLSAAGAFDPSKFESFLGKAFML